MSSTPPLSQPPPSTRGPALSLGAPRGRGGRGVAGSNGTRPPPGSTASQRADAAIRSTDNDAMGSRLSAMLQHYLPSSSDGDNEGDDPFTGLLASSEATTSATLVRRAPIINIGTYLRCRAIDVLVAQFLRVGNGDKSTQRRPKQIISLGAGSDSRFWRLHSDSHFTPLLRHYVELDFPQLTTAKVERIMRHKPLSRLIVDGDDDEPEISPDRSTLQSSRYSLIACDLRTLPSDTDAIAKLQRYLDPDVDTLILAECVLAYLSPAASDDLLAFLSGCVSRACAMCYEMCVAGDTGELDAHPSRFGQVMLSNLESRGLSMPGSRAYATLHSHARRFKDAFRHTFDGQSRQATGQSTARTLKQVWHALDESEKLRLSRLEGLDEVEELEILLSHYAISWYAYDEQGFTSFLDSSL